MRAKALQVLMNKKHSRIILDPVHGFIPLSPIQEELLSQPEVQRMRWVKQLGVTDLVFPGGHHSRIEHCLGASFIAGQMSDHLGLPENEKTFLQAAALLHDIGHTPFSHVLEPLLPKDSMESTRDMIEGRKEIPLPNAGKIPAILEKFGINPKDISDLICHCYAGKKYLQQIIFSELDCDQLDYLARDSYFTGAGHGQINIQRLISVMRLDSDEIFFLEKGVAEIEEYIVGKEHMYGTVYLHHTNNAATKMLLRAFEKLSGKFPDFLYMTDGEVISALLNGTPYTKDIAQRVLFRRLFKTVFEISSRSAAKKEIEVIKKLSEKGEKAIEKELSKAAGIPEGYLFVHLPANVLSLTEPRMKTFNINFLRKNGTKINIMDISSIATAVSKRIPTRELFAVYAPEKYLEQAQHAAKEIFN